MKTTATLVTTFDLRAQVREIVGAIQIISPKGDGCRLDDVWPEDADEATGKIMDLVTPFPGKQVTAKLSAGEV